MSCQNGAKPSANHTDRDHMCDHTPQFYPLFCVQFGQKRQKLHKNVQRLEFSRPWTLQSAKDYSMFHEIFKWP
jgi:hypothetical protein